MAVRLIRRYPFLSYAAFCIGSLLVIVLMERLGQGYDDGGLGSAAFLLSTAWAFIAFPFHLASELLLAIKGGEGLNAPLSFALASGTLVCVVAELGLQRWRGRGAA